MIRKYAEAREMLHISTTEPEDIDCYEDYQRVIEKGGCCN
jgi:molybdenum cofactor cytidylyltransferase